MNAWPTATSSSLARAPTTPTPSDPGKIRSIACMPCWLRPAHARPRPPTRRRTTPGTALPAGCHSGR